MQVYVCSFYAVLTEILQLRGNYKSVSPLLCLLLQSAEGKEGRSHQWDGIKTEGRAKEPAKEEWSQWDKWDSLSETQQLQ